MVARARGASAFRIALAGGGTPKLVYERLAEEEADWSAWHVWWSDDRVVPPDHPDSNERMAREALLDRVAIPEEQIHPLRSVDVELPERFDLVLLGIGPDGHCASLFPGDAALEATEPIAYVERPGLPPYHPRLTFTYPVLNGARTTAFLVGGDEKREIVARILAGDESLPAARVRAPETVLLADEAAAGVS
ncbi:MAG: 6-phosphogluconolactonase [Actinobacteria bacterium]|nr:6-phosphogluconolactonase [Actinomycetota bacterium]